MIHLDLSAEAARTLTSFSNVNLLLLTFNPGRQANWFVSPTKFN